MKNLKFAKSLVLTAAFYNASALIVFLLPGGVPFFGVSIPDSSFWRVLPALLALFASVVLFLSSKDLTKYGSFPYWNGIIRVTFATVAIILNYKGTIGLFIGLVAIIDFFVGLSCIVAIPPALQKSHFKVLTIK
jgi:hypothetical protein